MISYPWTVSAEDQGQDINEFKHFKRWFGRSATVRQSSAAWTGNNLRVDPAP